MKKKVRRGFTLVEVTLFLAMTGLIFAGVVIGVQSSMFQQRYNDSVQSFTDFLTSLYAQTTNVENYGGKGTGDEAIYGRLAVFSKESGKSVIKSYMVLGNADASKVKSADFKIDDSTFEEYYPRWGAKIQNTNGDVFQGAVLVYRDPSSGSVKTLVCKREGDNCNINKISSNYSSSDVDFCVSLEGSDMKRDIRIVKGAKNSAGVKVINQDDKDNNKCKR